MVNGIFYHGTTMDVVPRIKREGLQPRLNRAYNFISREQMGIAILAKLAGEPLDSLDTNNRTRDGYIFLTASKEVGQIFATFRSLYELAPAGAWIGMGKVKILKQPNEFVRRGKAAQPAVIELALPEDLARLVVPDKQADDDLFGYQFKGSIPPEYIAKVMPIEEQEDGTQKQKAAFKEAA